MQTSAPEVCAMLDTVNQQEVEPIVSSLELAYSRLKSADFAKQVLSANTERLFVLNLGDVGWSDLGEPSRVQAALGLANATRKPVTSAAQVGAVGLWGNARSKADGTS
jgi:precorrin-6B methylase 1